MGGLRATEICIKMRKFVKMEVSFKRANEIRVKGHSISSGLRLKGPKENKSGGKLNNTNRYEKKMNKDKKDTFQEVKRNRG